MNDATQLGAQHRSSPLTFHFWMALILAIPIFSGFGLTYLGPMASGTLSPMPPVVHVHGLFYFSWMLLLIIQAILIGSRNLMLHKSLGTFGIFVASIMIALGTILTVLFSNLGGKEPSPNHWPLSYLSVVAVPSFGLLFWAAIAHTRLPTIHRSMILLATIALLPPGINRLYMVSFKMSSVPLLATWLTMDVFVALVLWHEWRRTGRIAGWVVFGAAVIVLPQVFYPLLVDSEAFRNLCTWLGSFAVYR